MPIKDLKIGDTYDSLDVDGQRVVKIITGKTVEKGVVIVVSKVVEG